MVILVQTAHNTVVTLEGERPPAMNRSKSLNAILEMQGHVMIMAQLVIEESSKADEILVHMVVVRLRLFKSYGSSGAFVHGDDEVDKVFEQLLLPCLCGWRAPHPHEGDE